MDKTIYIADDEKNIRDLISSFLINDGFKVKAFENGNDLLNEFIKVPADMIVLDVMMDGTDGLTICSEIRQKNNVPIIIVSARDSELDRITGITMGSDDYLVKPFSPIELIARIKAIFRRIELDRNTTSEKILNFGDISLNTSTRQSTLNGEKLGLTPTEFTLLSYFFNNSDRVFHAKSYSKMYGSLKMKLKLGLLMM